MKKSFFTFLLLIVFVATACSNEAVNEGELREEKPQQVEEELVNEETSESENKDAINEDQTEEDAKDLVMENAEKVVKLLEEKNIEELSYYVHSEKGVLFSPYLYIDSDAITFNKEKVMDFFKESETHTWGAYDGTGDPMELTTSDYYSKFIYDGNYHQADEIIFDPVETRGNSLRNIDEVFPDSHTVEFFVEGTEEYGEMDWKALNLVFEKDEQGEWKLIAIVHDQWTI